MNKEQRDFPSDFCRDVWWWAVGIVPLSVSLSDEVKSKSTQDVLDGCHQWHAYFNDLTADMYNNENEYQPASPRQYRDILEHISAGGEIKGDSMVWDADNWLRYREKINKSKPYRTNKITLERCLKTLARTGLKFEYTENDIIFIHEKHPKIFHAMCVMEHSPDIRLTPARHHFAHCDFRRLYKKYAESHEELLRRVTDESLRITQAIHEFCKGLKVYRSVHFGIIKYKYDKERVLDYSLHKDKYPTLRVNIGTCTKFGADLNKDAFIKTLQKQKESVQDMFINNVDKCDREDCTRYPITINGHELTICKCSKVRVFAHESDVLDILSLIEARKASIYQYQ